MLSVRKDAADLSGGASVLWNLSAVDFAGFHPAAYGTEKFMDYGFMEAMMRSKTLPARDLWYSQGTINYYYGGQYFAVFLTKLTGSRVEVTYNLMRTFVAAFAFVYPFSLVRDEGQAVWTAGWKEEISSFTGRSYCRHCSIYRGKCTLYRLPLCTAADPEDTGSGRNSQLLVPGCNSLHRV